MAKNEDGEIELVLVNKQLVAVFFIVVVLLGLSFMMGYIVARMAEPPVQAALETATPAATPPPIVVSSPVQDEEESPAEPEDSPEPPKQTASQAPPQTAAPKPEPAAKAEAPKAAAAKPVPPPAPPKADPPKVVASQATGALPPARSAPIAGRAYLQISATTLDKADALVTRIRQQNFSAIAAPVDNNPALYRVLVGPLEDSAVDGTRARLLAAGFEDARDSIRRVF